MDLLFCLLTLHLGQAGNGHDPATKGKVSTMSKHHKRQFADSKPGRIRRDERRAVIGAKRAFLAI